MLEKLIALVSRRVAPPRYVIFAALLVLLLLGMWSQGLALQVALLASFDLAATVFLLSALPLLNDEVANMRLTAVRNDTNRVGLLAITLLLLAVVLFAIGGLLAHRLQREWFDIPLILSSLILAWLFANTIFALHYAHLYYRQSGAGDARGLDFPETATPNYWDFLYFSLTLGMTFQTSDVTINGGHMRRVVLVQTVAAFFFNMGVLAFAINTLGSL